MKYTISLLFIIVSTTIFANNKTITINGLPSNAPYCYMNTRGELDGYIPQVAKAIMDDLNLDYTFDIDIMQHMYHYNTVSERNKYVNLAELYMTGVVSNKKRAYYYYSIPYLSIEFYILSRKDILYSGIADLADKCIGVTNNHPSESKIQVSKDNIDGLNFGKIIVYNKLQDGLKHLAQDNDVDYMIVDEQSLTINKKQIEELGLEISYANLEPLNIAIASKDKELIAKVNKSISSLKNKGTFDKLFSKYVLTNKRVYIEKTLVTTIIISGIIILILIIIIFICKKIISRNIKTKLSLLDKIEENSKAFMFIANNAPMAIFIKDIHTQNLLYHNNAFCDIFDVKDHNKVTNFLQYINDKHVINSIKESDKRALEEGGNVKYNIKVVLKSGRAKFLFVNKSLITYENKSCLLSITLDYGEQMHIESNNKILNLSKPLIKAYTWSFDGRSKSFVYGSGYDTKDQIISRTIQDDKLRGTHIHSDHNSLIEKEIQKLLTKGSGDSQIKFLTKVENSKDYKWWEMYMRAETKSESDTKYVMIHGFNIKIDKQIRNEESLKLMVKELNAAKAKAEESEQMKSMFLANMSHEIRTPLNAIVGFSSLMSEATSEESEEFAGLIKMNGDILINLINDILELSKIDAGIPFNESNINFSQFFNEITTSLIYKHNNPEVEFIIDSPYDTLMCIIDQNRIGQIITNFTTNAIKHTLKGCIKIGYSYNNNILELYVEDTGRGIPDNKQHLLFQRFQKLDDVTRGTGLGLSIVAAIVLKMNGEYGFESKQGVGSRFWVRIKPTITSFEQAKKTNTFSLPIATVKKDNINSVKAKYEILLAEDVMSNVLLIKKWLEKYNITHVQNGSVAVTELKKRHFDLVLMDISMPVMSGIDATTKIREFNKNIPIIAITANAFVTDKEAALTAGCNSFLTKPLDKNNLIKEIEYLINLNHNEAL